MGIVKTSVNLKKEFNNHVDITSGKMTQAGKEMVKAGVKRTMSKPYWYSGVLANSWHLNVNSPSQKHVHRRKIKAPVVTPKIKGRNFKFSLKKHHSIFVTNTAPYSEFVSEGINPLAGDQVPADFEKYILKAFEDYMVRGTVDRGLRYEK